jgi:hypothetical protein
MRTGIIVDGQAEPEALSLALRRLRDIGPFHIVYARIQPTAAPARIAEMARDQVEKLLARGAQRIVLLIDREDRDDCAPGFAAAIESAMLGLGTGQVRVVVKNRKFENWLIADPDALARLRKRFEITEAFRRHVGPDKADNVPDAEAWLARATRGDSYHKRGDPLRIMRVLDVRAAAKNSRSLRRFLRVLGWPGYRDQSKRP